MKLKEETKKFINLTDEEVMKWAGNTIFMRGERYFLEGCVNEIEVYPDGSFAAEVEGSDIYEVIVGFKEKELFSQCSCPYEYSPCKHAVAAVLKYREGLREGIEIEEIDFDERHSGCFGLKRDDSGNDDPVRSYLESLTKEKLIELIEDIALEHRDIAYKLKQAEKISSGQLDKVVKKVKKKIKKLTNEPVYDQWNGNVNIPDYSSLKDEFRQILYSGHADEVVELGEALFEDSKEQIETCDDEGETQRAIELCMDVFFEALGKSSLSIAQQIKKIIDMLDDDEDYLINDPAYTYFDGDFKREKWDEIANLLHNEYENAIEESSTDTQLLKEWIIISLDKAGRGSEVIPFLKSNAEGFEDYELLVDRLIGDKKLDEAVELIFKCLKSNHDGTDAFGWFFLNNIRIKLAEIYETKGDLHSTASVYADLFFSNPTLESYKKMIEISEEISLKENIQRYAIKYLESGEIPFNKKEWPLPEIGLTKFFKFLSRHTCPILNLLVEISLFENKHDETLTYFDKINNNLYGYGFEEKIADAVKETHPERSILIWKKFVKSLIDKTSRKYYEKAYFYLLKIRNVLIKQNNESEWNNYINDLRMKNKMKRAFIAVVKNI